MGGKRREKDGTSSVAGRPQPGSLGLVSGSYMDLTYVRFVN